MQVGDLVKLKCPQQFPGHCDAAGLLIDIESPRVPDAAADAGANSIMTVLYIFTLYFFLYIRMYVRILYYVLF